MLPCRHACAHALHRQRRTRISSILGRHPNASCANLRVTVSPAAFRTATATPLVRFGDAMKYGTLRLQSRTSDPSASETERREVRDRKASVEHAEAFRG